MTRRLAGVIVRISAWLVPSHWRTRWKEEWLAEIQASSPKPQAPVRNGALRRALGAPKDAWLLRVSTWRGPHLRLGTGWLADLRDAGRSWRRAPLQSLLIVASLTLGSTLLLLVASYVNAMVAADLPGIRERGGLAHVRTNAGPGPSWVTISQFRTLETRADLGASIAMVVRSSSVLLTAAQPVQLSGAYASGGLFALLGTRPALGRLLQPQDDRPGAPEVAVLGYAFWQTHFGGRADILGTRIAVADRVSGARSFEIVGVTEEGFTGINSGNLGAVVSLKGHLWLPLASISPESRQETDVIARLGPQTSMTTAETALQAAFQSLPAEPREARRPALALSRFIYAPITDPVRVAWFSLTSLSIPATVLLIACLNIAALQMARATSRRAEFRTRAALGASTGRILRLLAVDIAGLALLSTVAAWLLTSWLLKWSALVMPVVIEPDWRLALFAALVPLGVTAIAGWLPVRRLARVDLSTRFRHARTRGQRAMVIAQLSLSLVLLLTGSLVMRGALELAGRGPDADVRREVLVGEIQPIDGLGAPPDSHATRDRVLELAAALPGSPRAALSTVSPFGSRSLAYADSPAVAARDRQRVDAAYVTPAYFEVLGHRIVAGRGFEPGERDVAVVNEAFANERLQGGSPIGRRLTVFEGQQPPRDLVIVGVVSGGWTRGYLEGSPRSGPARLLFAPLEIAHAGNLTVYARSPQAAAIAPAFKELLVRAAPGALATSSGTMGDRLGAISFPFVVLGRILGGVSLVALGLAALGLFGVVSLFVARRTREFGVRYALGARPDAIRRIVLRDAARISALGVLAGLALSIPVFFLMRANFVGVRPWDPLATAVGVGVMVLATVAASLWPARRASAIDPLAALRSE